MKKRLPFVWLVFLAVFFCFEPLAALAQEAGPEAEPRVEFDFQKAYEDYTYNYNLYLEAHKEYLIAKNQYETYKTLTAKTIALEQTIRMLQNRDRVLATFLIAFRIKLADETNVASSTLNLFYIQLDEKANWYHDHRKMLTSAGSIPDLLALSDETQERYPGTQELVYKSLLEMFLYKENSLSEKIDEQVGQIEEKIAEIRENADKDTSSIERWLLEAKNRKIRSGEKLSQAEDYVFGERLDEREKRQVFNRTVSTIEEAHQYLKEANTALLEIIREIKNGD